MASQWHNHQQIEAMLRIDSQLAAILATKAIAGVDIYSIQLISEAHADLPLWEAVIFQWMLYPQLWRIPDFNG